MAQTASRTLGANVGSRPRQYGTARWKNEHPTTGSGRGGLPTDSVSHVLRACIGGRVVDHRSGMTRQRAPPLARPSRHSRSPAFRSPAQATPTCSGGSRLRWLYLLVLLEFQSTIDRRMALRMMDHGRVLQGLDKGDLAPAGSIPSSSPSSSTTEKGAGMRRRTFATCSRRRRRGWLDTFRGIDIFSSNCRRSIPRFCPGGTCCHDRPA